MRTNEITTEAKENKYFSNFKNTKRVQWSEYRKYGHYSGTIFH